MRIIELQHPASINDTITIYEALSGKWSAAAITGGLVPTKTVLPLKDATAALDLLVGRLNEGWLMVTDATRAERRALIRARLAAKHAAEGN